MSATSAVPAYFEESWAILSSIGLVNVLFGLMIVGITSLSQISLVPIIVSVAGAIANGLCYYAFYADYAKNGTVVAAAVADLTWLVRARLSSSYSMLIQELQIQEAGLSFYSYLILVRVLKNQSRIVFMSLFWTIMAGLLTIRMFILASRAKDILQGSTSRQTTIDHLHVGYFSSIALVECISAFFLLRKFAAARRTSVEASSTSGLFSYLMKARKSDLRLWQSSAFREPLHIRSKRLLKVPPRLQASATASCTHSSACFLSCFCRPRIRSPYTEDTNMCSIDILASKLVVTNHIHESSSQSRSRQINNTSSRKHTNGLSDISIYPGSHVETRVDAHGVMSSSQERIFEGTLSQAGTHHSSEEIYELQQKGGAITKTVEFDFHESAA